MEMIVIIVGFAVAYRWLLNRHDDAQQPYDDAEPETVPQLAVESGQSCMVMLLYGAAFMVLFMVTLVVFLAASAPYHP